MLVASAMTNSTITARCRVSGRHALHLHRHGQARGWASGPLGLGSAATRTGAERRSYANEFRTLPDPTEPLAGPFTFAVIGDFGAGIRRPSTATRRQREVGLALQRAVDTEHVRLILTTGDNIYAAQRFLALDRGLGRRRRRLVLHVTSSRIATSINRVPVCPSIGNHDTRRDRGARRPRAGHGQFLPPRAARQRRGRRAVRRSARGCSIAFASRRTSSSSASIPPRNISSSAGGCSSYPKHRDVRRRNAFPAAAERDPLAHPVRPSSAVLRRAAAPQHRRRWSSSSGCSSAAASAPLQRSRAQLPALAPPTASTISCRAPAARSDRGVRRAHGRGAHRQLGGECHFLLVTIAGDAMTVRAIGDDENGVLKEIARFDRDGHPVSGPITVPAVR